MQDIEMWRVVAGEVVELPAGGELVSGMPKLLQYVLIALLQSPDSVKYRFGKRQQPGCYFMQALHSGTLRTEADVFAQFHLAKQIISSALRQQVRASDPPDETFKDIRLDSITLSPGWLRLHITLTSKVSALKFILPIKLGV